MNTSSARPVDSTPPPRRTGRLRRLHRRTPDYSTWGPVVAFVLLFALFSLLKPDVFLTSDNLISILNDQAVLVVLACGLTVVVIAGEFDLSIASAMSLGGLFGAGLIAKSHMSVAAVIPAVIVMGLVIGFVNGVLVSIFKVQSLIATLAVGSILDGLSLAYSGGNTIFSGVSASYLQISRWHLGTVKAPVFYAAGLALLLWAFLRYTPAGRSIEATGGNRLAATMAGVRVNRYVILAFMISGACATTAGMLQTAKTGSAQPLFASSFLLPAFAGVFLGSATLRKGQFHIPGTVFGVYLVAVGSAGFVILGAPFYTTQLFSGAVLIFATASAGVLARMKFRGPRPTPTPGIADSSPLETASDPGSPQAGSPPSEGTQR
jgi:ribose transport system permease protein